MAPPVPEQRWLAYHYTKLGRWTYFGWWTPQYQSRDALNTTTQNLADEPNLANGPPSSRAEMTCIPVHTTWQMNLHWPMDPQFQSRDALHTSTHNLADEPTLANGPPYQSRDALNTSTQNLADEPTLANGPLSTKAEMPWIPVHTTWQMNLLWPMDPPVPGQRWLAYQYTKHGRWTYFCQWTTPSTRAEMTCIPVHTTWQMNLLWPMDPHYPPHYQSRDDLHTSMHNLADEPTLANGPPLPPHYQSRDDLHTTTQTWQMNLPWLKTMAKFWKL